MFSTQGIILAYPIDAIGRIDEMFCITLSVSDSPAIGDSYIVEYLLGIPEEITGSIEIHTDSSLGAIDYEALAMTLDCDDTANDISEDRITRQCL